eukprot:TRINITY_DN690_c0_g1::TRINITY_DN690_c0_g1_i1::g.28787::m.28787 TRINITY_DN690_c0_g1::TRINITY_DN690_c0_g1_i1::g.28787  ORF type:complete len:100 (+),score=37.94,sp/P55857/SUMO1_ORYSJ/55.10/7e-31,Rad60-SLD/PF11976.3/1.3e-25,ubiquitin/PF00240.18/2.4e-08 TRINITY_DN690_c0_g1_i1:87-386(+)
MSEENKPDVKPNLAGEAAGGDQINIKVKAQDGNEVYFKIKKTTKMVKVIQAYCTRVGVAKESQVFLFDGERIRDDATPEELEMEDGDAIDVMHHQVGGF